MGEVALGVTNEAITAFETANSQETIKNSAELATKALEQLARHKDVSIRYVINIHFPMVIATIYEYIYIFNACKIGNSTLKTLLRFLILTHLYNQAFVS